jgi:hypothetical protein
MTKFTKPTPDNPDDRGEPGPAMRALRSEKQRAFVMAALADPYASQAVWAQRAGYVCKNRNNLSRIAYELLRDVRIAAAMREVAGVTLTSQGVALATRNLLASAQDKKNPRLAYDASLQILSRSGLGEKNETRLIGAHLPLGLPKILVAMTQAAIGLELGSGRPQKPVESGIVLRTYTFVQTLDAVAAK